MRYMLKGGVWKNAEDEILKAAVSKYGLNQWSRISSLMVRKSAKQCKARWYEWLDPSIKKIDWTKEEEEKLLHLAKIFPCQWRTIAPIVGRTPNQCVEHYERLLEQAQGKMKEDDLRSLKPGEIDPNPETKPAKPDEIDMDEDMREMLAEARVRLANTKGKKAKRKAREKIIEEARRLALMQKKREMKAAGIEYIMTKRDKIRDRKWKKVMNYNKEIPFERQVPEFVYQNIEGENPRSGGDVGNISLQTLEGQRKEEEEEKLRKIDQKRIKKLKERNMPLAIEKINRLNKIHKEQGTKMVLPFPQLQDQDLELLAKLKNISNDGLDDGIKVTNVLVGNYSGLRDSSVQRTPRIQNQIMDQVRSIQSIIESKTPLIGGPDRIQHYDNNVNGQSQSRLQSNAQTPFTQKYFNSTPNSMKLSDTPQRQDQLKINEPYIQNWEQENQLSIKEQLKQLPKPINSYELQIPELVQDQEEQEQMVDRELVEIQDMVQKKVKVQIKEAKKSLAVQKNLPRPKQINLKCLEQQKTLEQQLVDNQIVHLLAYDSVNYPLQGCKPEKKILQHTRDLMKINKKITVKYLQKAEGLVNQELQKIKQEMEIDEDQIVQQMEQEQDKLYSQYIFDPFSRSMKFKHELTEIQLQEVNSWHIQKELESMGLEQKQIERLENKARQILQSYELKFKELGQQILKLDKENKEYEQQIEIFKELKQREEVIGYRRVKDQKQSLEELKKQEDELQEMYRRLRDEQSVQ